MHIVAVSQEFEWSEEATRVTCQATPAPLFLLFPSLITLPLFLFPSSVLLDISCNLSRFNEAAR